MQDNPSHKPHNSAALYVRLEQASPIALQAELSCERGELLALTGPSGSGKSTVLRMIAGLQKVQHGEVRCNGNTWLDTQQALTLKPQKRSVGLVFQHYALFPHLSVLDNVKAAMSHINAKERTEEAMKLLALTNMHGLHLRRPQTLSGGQKQRVALARALAREPDVLLLDEPFSAVDQLTRRKLYRELARIRQSLEMPMILVTHDMNEVQILADSLCLIHHGNTLQSGAVNDVLRRPLTASCARLLGHQNVFSGEVKNNNNQDTLHLLGTTFCDAKLHIPRQGKVTALIEPSAVIMHRNDRPSLGERENPVSTVVEEAIELGDDLSLRLRCTNSQDSITFKVSRHVAQRNHVQVGTTLVVSLLSEGIHIMPPES